MPGRGKARPDVRKLRSRKRQLDKEQGDSAETQAQKKAASTPVPDHDDVEIVSLCGDGESSGRPTFQNDVQHFDNIFRPAEFVRKNYEIEEIRCGGDDLALHVPLQLKEKIWRNEYINLSLLLKGSIELNEFCSGGSIQLNNESGCLETRPKSVKQSVYSIEDWSDAFIIFCSIYWHKFPEATQPMLKYLAMIREADHKFSSTGWRAYDQQFRLKQSNPITRQSWGSINSELYVRTMIEHTKSTFIKPLSERSPPVREFTCNDFNYGFCSRAQCKFKHACMACNSFTHGKSTCQKVRQGFVANNNYSKNQTFFRGQHYNSGGSIGKPFARGYNRSARK